MELINEEIQGYCRDCTTDESDMARYIQEKTNDELQYSNMLSGEVTGQFLKMLVQISGAKKVLEVGMFTGYSALRMAEALPEEGTLITCDYNERYERMARSSFEKSKAGQKITIKMGKALDTLQTVEGPFDLIFLDADKANYPNYYEMLFQRLKLNGLLIVDNVLWSGRVLDPPNKQSSGIDKLNKKIAADNRVEQVMLTVRDGMNLVRKTST